MGSTVCDRTPDPTIARVRASRRYSDLEPLAAEVLKGARMLLIFSIIRLPSLEGLLGLLAAVSILFWAAPGSLGVAYSSRQVRRL